MNYDIAMQMNLNLNIEDATPKLLLKDKTPSSLDELPSDCVIVDIETTGFSAKNDSIIEISALKVSNDKIIAEFSSLVKSLKPIPPFISRLTGIKPDMLSDAPSIKTVLRDFCDFISESPIVGHNIKFDLSFLNSKLKDLYNKTLPNDYADTLVFSRKIYTELTSHKLTNIAGYLNIDTLNAHRALKDCHMTFCIMEDMKKRAAKIRETKAD